MPSSKSDLSKTYAVWCLALVVTIVTAFTLLHAGHYFSQDDFAGMYFNAETLKDVGRFFIPEPDDQYFFYRPISFQLKFWLTREAFGFNPVPFHLLPLIFHLAGILLCYRFFHSLSGRRDIALLAAALYGLCGAHQKSLYWISAGNEHITAFFFLLGLNAFLDWRKRPDIIRAGSVVLLYIIMILCKETALLFPFVLLLTDFFFPTGASSEKRAAISGRITLYAVLFVIALARIAFWFLVLSPQTKGQEKYLLMLNPLTLAANFVSYVVQVFIGNAIIYGALLELGKGDPSEYAKQFLLSRYGMAFGLIVIAILIFVILWIRRFYRGFDRREKRLTMWGAVWFIICLIPVLPILAQNNAYYLNIPMIGFSGCLAVIALGIGRQLRRKRLWRVIGWTLLVLYTLNFAANTLLGARILPHARSSFIARNAMDWVTKAHPEFEPGSVLIILGVDELTWWSLDNGFLFKAYYRDQLRDCYVLKKGGRLPMGYVSSFGLDDEENVYIYSYDNSAFTPRDKEYFINNYTRPKAQSQGKNPPV